VAVIEINGTDTGWTGTLFSENFKITYTAEQSRELFWLPGTLPLLLEGPQTIYQVIILLPSAWTGCCFDGESELLNVEVCNTDTDCCAGATAQIQMLPLGLDQ
jgi:hypothetical protein